ncbi:MAG: DUF4136 domain-containing protein [Woeseiaceae bacterium]|nr:DUF4136 domain-containing protein [Woeseiaceae bacterium]
MKFARDRLNKIMAIVVVAVFGIGGCATKIDTFVDHDSRVAFHDLETFAWISEHPLVSSSQYAAANPFLEARIQDAIQDELTSRGYRFVEDDSAADFVISFSVGGRKDLSVESYPVAYRNRWTLGGTYIGESVSVEQNTEGTLAIDFFSANTRSPIWHGVARKNLTAAEEKLRGSIIRDAVAAILVEFPPQPG